MNIKKIAKEISESMYPHLEVGAMDYKKKDRERLVSIVETKLNNNEVLDLVSGCFSFAKHFKQNYEFHQYTTEGKEIYITDTGVVRTEYEVMEHWKTYYR